ncbi:ADP-ribosyltransferase [Paludibacterium paludis]|uniref:ADP ribosyltransferase domain-containing protein n=1 Tax=Paludibacterium paludis TaxID=1225769 RepID=A0A918P6S5_9NEIS|nr:ADP-ribosyltransferase [Paludibacterium paludis]GGY26773.1 hypothetical protein GCM10011289_32940 [Paludibacterium paludis]
MGIERAIAYADKRIVHINKEHEKTTNFNSKLDAVRNTPTEPKRDDPSPYARPSFFGKIKKLLGIRTHTSDESGSRKAIEKTDKNQLKTPVPRTKGTSNKANDNAEDYNKSKSAHLYEQLVHEAKKMLLTMYPNLIDDNEKFSKGSVDNYLNYVENAHKNNQPPINLNEYMSLHEYGNTFFEDLNKTLRNGEPDKYKPAVEAMRSGIEKLTDNKVKKTFRGEGASDYIFTQGGKQLRKAFTSTSSDFNVALNFASKDTKNSKLMVVFGRSAASIDGISGKIGAQEDELLYPDGSEFSVLFKFDKSYFLKPKNNSSANTIENTDKHVENKTDHSVFDEEKLANFLENVKEHGEKRIADIVGSETDMMKKQGTNEKKIEQKIEFLRHMLNTELKKKIALFKSGIPIVIMEEAGLPPDSGHQGYIEALGLAKDTRAPRASIAGHLSSAGILENAGEKIKSTSNNPFFSVHLATPLRTFSDAPDAAES